MIQLTEPVNKFPDFVRYLVKQLKVLLATMGKARIDFTGQSCAKSPIPI